MKNIEQDSFNVIINICLIILIILGFVGCDSYNRENITVIDQDVRIVDKYHKAEDCTYYDTTVSCDPEEFRIVFDNGRSIDLKQNDLWSNVHEGQLWHYHALKGRLWIIEESSYRL